MFVGRFHASVAACRLVDGRLALDFVPGKSPLDGGATSCVRRPEDPLVKSLLSCRRVELAGPIPPGKGKGRGRGKGRGGRRGKGKGK